MKELCFQLERVVRQWPELESVAFLHGMLTGELCGAEQLSVSDFIGGLLKELEVSKVQESVLNQLYRLYEATLAGLTSAECDLQLCLPDDSHSLHDRALAVRQWCEGFIYGFGLTHGDRRDLMDEVKEYLETIMEVSQINLDELQGVEDDELAAQLEEIIEFLRIGAIAVYENLHPTPPRAPVTDSIPEPTHKTIQ